MEPDIGPREKDRSTHNRPDWRWRQAKHILDRTKGKDPKKYKIVRTDDYQTVNTILPFLAEYEKCARSLEGMRKLREEHPGLLWAAETNRDGKISEIRWIVEALICGDVSHQYIADSIMVPVNHVWWYEHAFFDVRDILDNPMLMRAEILSRLRLDETRVEDFLWKSIAWKHGLGPEGLRRLLHPSFGLSPETVVLFKLLIEQKMAIDTIYALETRKINSFNNNLVIDQFQRAVETGNDDDDIGGTGGSGDEVNTMLNAFLGTMSQHVRIAKYNTEFHGAEGADVEGVPGSELFEQRREANAAAEAEVIEVHEVDTE
ncbi:MAG TPA: hypothetical protein ENH11_10580 [Candidatus Acetothermia bacterium]|nr:hypothetical protein [Candidatus Acetothermia bacterium]